MRLPKPENIFGLRFFILLFVFICLLAGTQICRADEFGIGQFQAEPDSFNPNQGEITTITGVVYHLSPEANLSSPSVTIKINEQIGLPVEISLLSSEQLVENSSALLSEWSFSASWDGRNERGETFSPGEYTYTITLNLPNVGEDKKSGTVKIIED